MINYRMTVQRKKTIVCIGNSPDDMVPLAEQILGRKRFKRVLEWDEFDVVGINDSQEGLKIVREIKPALVLVDLTMPNINGWEIYQQIKADDELKDIEVLVTTPEAESIDKLLR